MTLTQLFTAIANQIRRLKGTSGTIVAENFPTEMSEIKLGKLTDEEYEISNNKLDEILEGSTPAKIYPPNWSEIGYEDTPASIIEAFNYAKEIQDDWDESLTSLSSKFRNDTNLIYMPLINTTNVMYMSNTFNSCYYLEKIPLLDTSNVVEMSSMFFSCDKLASIPLLDISNGKYMGNMFNSCASLIEIPNLDTSNSTTMQMMFYKCQKLTTIPVLNTSKVTNMNNTFGNCSSLSNESLNNIMAMCINATSYTGTKTLKQIGLTSEQATTCQGLSNYQAFLNAGWTTGY